MLTPFPVRRYFIKRGLWTDYRDAGVGYTIVISLQSHLSVWEINCSLRIKGRNGGRKEVGPVVDRKPNRFIEILKGFSSV